MLFSREEPRDLKGPVEVSLTQKYQLRFMEENEYAAWHTPALQRIISRRKEDTWHVREYDATNSFDFFYYFTLEF